MTHPTDEDQHAPKPPRLLLDEGEGLELQPSAADTADIVLRLRPSRAYDLSQVLDAYTALVDLTAQAGEVSSTERSLARGLRDAADAAGHRRPLRSPTVIHAAERLSAMSELQEARPELSHSTLVALTDAVVRLIEDGEDYDATGLLDAVTADGAGAQVYLTLTGWRLPRPPEEGVTSGATE